MTLLRRLEDDPTIEAVVGIDSSGREQPLQLALQPAAAGALVKTAGPGGAAGSIGPSTTRCAATQIGQARAGAGCALDIDA